MLLLNADCLEAMEGIPDNSIDMVLCDPPYGTTACKWDSIIPSQPMWKELRRVIKTNGAIVLFGYEPFSSLLRSSNIREFKYDWVWHKDKPTNHLNVRRQPMRRNELISVFYKKQCLYNPQLTPKEPKNIRPPTHIRPQADNYGSMNKPSTRTIPVDMKYPDENLYFDSCSARKGRSFHPTEKPVPLLEYLIKTYTNEGETVLDFTMGSGSTGVACQNLNREFIGIELDKDYFQVAKSRLELP